MNGLALFAGVGALDLGINLAIPSSRTICYVEGEAYAASVLVSKMEQGWLHKAPVWSDVTSFDGKIWSGKVDFISAGFPCQPWSLAGKQKGKDDERWLWDDIIRIIGEVRPQYLFLENVPGVINGGLDPILRTLAQIGFNAEWGCFKASDIGARHHRNRFFLFAYVSNSDSIGGSKSGNKIIQQNGSKFDKSCQDGDVQHSYDLRLPKFDISPQPKELGFIMRGYDKEWSRPEWWRSEPSVGRVVDGVAHRVDRLRACGNGVVPLQAATAYSILIQRAIEGGGLNGA